MSVKLGQPRVDRYGHVRAARRVRSRRVFLLHLAVFLLVTTVLVLISRAADAGTDWFVIPLIGWGILLFIHFLGLLAIPAKPHSRERMIDRELHRHGS